MIIRDGWREPVGKATYASSGKEPPPSNFQSTTYAYWMLAGQMEKRFGGEPATVGEIYHQVTGPLGLTSSETVQLVRSAKKEGYLK